MSFANIVYECRAWVLQWIGISGFSNEWQLLPSSYVYLHLRFHDFLVHMTLRSVARANESHENFMFVFAAIMYPTQWPNYHRWPLLKGAPLCKGLHLTLQVGLTFQGIAVSNLVVTAISEGKKRVQSSLFLICTSKICRQRLIQPIHTPTCIR